MNAEAYRIFGLRPDPSNLGRAVRRCPTHPPRHRPGAGERVRAEPPAEPRRAAAQGHGQGDRLHALAGARRRPARSRAPALFFKDLTRVEQLEERERLRDRLAALGEMAAAMAHELKNPLAGIEVMAGLLRRKVPESPDAQSMRDRHHQRSEDGERDGRGSARLRAAGAAARPSGRRSPSVLHDAVTMADGKARRGAIAVDLVVPDGSAADPGRPPAAVPGVHEPGDQRVRGDERTRARGDRRAHGVDGRRARRTRRGAGHRDLVDVSDDGPGVPPELADRIFNPFFTTKAQGSGLGLAIVRKIVDAHDGRIDLRSAPGEGTRFTVTLPVTGSRRAVVYVERRARHSWAAS